MSSFRFSITSCLEGQQEIRIFKVGMGTYDLVYSRPATRADLATLGRWALHRRNVVNWRGWTVTDPDELVRSWDAGYYR